jgi:hypothetical protein
MTALAQARPIDQVAQYMAAQQCGVDGGSTIYEGAMVCFLTATGYAVPAGTASTGPVQGIAAFGTAATVDGDHSVDLLAGMFWRANGGTVTQAHFGRPVYASDDQTISASPSAGPLAGICRGVDSDLGVLVEIDPAANEALNQNNLTGDVSVPFTAAILAAGTPMAAFADNASSNPGVTLVDSKAMGIRWNNNASQTAVFTRFDFPLDMDTSTAPTLKFRVSKSGATVGDAVKMTVAIFNNVVGALHDADTDYGGDTDAIAAPSATAKTISELTLTLATTDIPAGGTSATMSFKPKDGTLGTDDCILHSARLVYKRKPLTA